MKTKETKKLKVALVHDFLTEYGGAERVLEVLTEMFPDAPIYTAYVDTRNFGQGGKYLKNSIIRSSIFQKIPFFARILSPMRLVAPAVFRRFDLDEFDVVISSTNTYFAKAVKVRGVHICYCHTPPRYLYGYPTARNWKKNIFGRVIGELMNFYLRLVDYEVSQLPNVMIANSQEVAGRIAKFYKRTSEVVYPPIDVAKAVNGQRGEYFLVVSRLARAKRVDLAVAAANKLKVNLVVVGSGIEREKLEKTAGKTVKFLGFVPDEELWKIYAKAKAFIFTAEEEDFGMTPVEAMAAGKYVIALRQGGVKESVVEGVTGIFFNDPTVASLVGAIKKSQKMKFDEKTIISHAKKFDKRNFIRKMRLIIQANA